MSQQLSPRAIVEVIGSLGRKRMDICREWKYLWKNYISGWPRNLPMKSLKSRDECALALGRMTRSDAMRMIFSSGGTVKMYGTMPKWLIPTAVEVSSYTYHTDYDT